MNFLNPFNGGNDSYIGQFQARPITNAGITFSPPPSLDLLPQDHFDPSGLLSMTPQNQVQSATNPNLSDNPTAAGVRNGYRQAFEKAVEQREVAAEEVARLGPGSHVLPNGDRVTITVDFWSGKKDVQTDRRDGSSTRVSYSDQEPNSVSIGSRNADGSTEHLDWQGTSISQSHTLPGGGLLETQTDNFSLDAQGRPIEEKGPLAIQRVRANQDGSADVFGDCGPAQHEPALPSLEELSRTDPRLYPGFHRPRYGELLGQA